MDAKKNLTKNNNSMEYFKGSYFFLNHRYSNQLQLWHV